MKGRSRCAGGLSHAAFAGESHNRRLYRFGHVAILIKLESKCKWLLP